MQVTLTISDKDPQRVPNAMKGLYPIPVNPEGHKKAGEAQFTADEWIKEVIKKWVVGQVGRYEQKVAQDAVKFTIDSSLVS